MIKPATILLRLLLLSLAVFFAGCSSPAENRTTASTAPAPAESMADFCKQLPRADYAQLTAIHSSDKWFQLYQVAVGVIAIYEPHQWQEVISYLIIGDDEALLFDTGNGIGDIYALVTSLTDKPISVLNSHSHYDHVGGNYAFKNIYGMNTEFTRVRQSGQSNDAISIEVSSQALCAPLPIGVSEDNHIGRPYRITQTIEDGFIIDLGNRQLEVLHIPGHTDDAIALIDRTARLMWTGDSFYAGPIWLYAPETDLTAYESSLRRLSTEIANVDWLLPAHNTPRVAAGILNDVLTSFEIMMDGDATPVNQGDGMVEYLIPNEARFSFLMRDEKLPYAEKP